MLLTSGQVSIAVSSAIIFLCTAALFLSGYVIQQRTLRDLRAAIKPSPRPSPKLFLPDRFKQSTTELADGSIIILDDGDGGAGQGGGAVVEVKPTLESDEKHEQNDVDVDAGRSQSALQPTKTGKKLSKTSKKKGKGAPVDDDESDEPQKPMSRAERRRRIKEEIMRLSQGEERGYYQRRLW
ncbi:hypothetical protein NEMBOFW57_001718 [Staphylotrichum longicolle]|uniref:Uncharacterized protein n=1 Tax=Staphylotrichum longicolle TaxID=669026 RepID=A0AAD4F2M1_9PEZI|nr:hypothetical protein NEMBOFW57_001718 [Staphylotrichum longicolle]